MTAKRFKLGYVCGDYGLIDNDKWIDLHSMSENSEKNVRICINKMNDLAEENEVCKEAYNEIKSDAIHLKEENEHIKQTIKDMINTERTELGKMTLRQLWRQIQ